MKLVATQGMNIDPGNHRFEPGDTITSDLTEKQRRDLIRSGYAVEADSARVSPKQREAILEQAGEDPAHPVTVQLDMKEQREEEG